MTQAINQFTQAPVQGDMDLRFNASIISGFIAASSGSGLVAGQSVKMVDDASGVPSFVECADDSDDVYGFIVFDIKSKTFDAGDMCEVAAMRNNVMWMTASAAIARNAKVMVVIASKKVATATSGNTIIGRALDKAAADGDLIRVTIDLPGALA